jgi:hypothetical protein
MTGRFALSRVNAKLIGVLNMKTVTKLLAASAVALSLAAIGAPAQALTQFASAAPTTAPAFHWQRDADQVGGNLTASASDWLFNFTLSNITGLSGLDSTFAFSARSEVGYSCVATAVCGNTGLDGSFSYTYDGPDIGYTLGGSSRVLHTGATLLSGSFLNGWIQGTGSSGSADASTESPYVTASVSNVVSDVIDFHAPFAFDFSFALSGANLNTPVLGKSYSNFNAGSSGAFAAATVPEPATWALMIMGFGGAGAMLRSQRRKALAAI